MKKVLIENIKSISRLEFEIPSPGLYVITGKNGTGKTTLFTCINRVCNNNAFRLGFPSSNNNTLDIFSGSISYSSNSETVKYSKRSSGRWDANKRNTSVLREFGYPAIFYATTKEDRIFTQDAINPRSRNLPDVWLNRKLNDIFDTDKFTSMIRMTTGDLRGRNNGRADGRRRNTAYVIPINDNEYYTERNFSFGEMVMLNLLHDVKTAPNGSLILIDELELALHPSAQIRLVNSLRELATEKGLTIIISTHSASIIKAEKNVILLEQNSENVIEVIYNCPPAKAIGAIGMREDTMPDIIVLVEDKMAKSLFFALKQKYNEMHSESSYLDIRILEIGGYPNVINFFVEADEYIFYDNVYVTAFLDKDVETDIFSFPMFQNRNLMEQFSRNSYYLRFLPYTPEVLLLKTFVLQKVTLLRELRTQYSNQQLQYSVSATFDFSNYEAILPEFQNQDDYNTEIKSRGDFRKDCKEEAEKIATELSCQINQSVEEVYRFVFKHAVECNLEDDVNIQALLAPTMKRLRRRERRT